MFFYLYLQRLRPCQAKRVTEPGEKLFIEDSSLKDFTYFLEDVHVLHVDFEAFGARLTEAS